MPQLKTCLLEKLSAYNETGSIQLPLVLFADAMRHLTRISRIITQPLGHALLVGVGGSGRESLARLATFVSDYAVFMVEVTRNFRLQQFRDCLKDLFRKV
jgi:dynein heavy chain